MTPWQNRVTELTRRMADDMKVRNYSQRTIDAYTYHVGKFADFVVLDADHIALQGLSASDMLSSHVFASHRTSAIDAVWVAGRPRVQAGRHPLHDIASAGFVAARRQLLQDTQ